ncbi:MAG: hypothetical protein GY856_09010 [bacterium]|nr:hypothetical protein [bacterium]
MTEIEAQKALLEIVLDLQRLDQGLYTLAQQLYRPENQDEMLEGKIPSDVATEIFGTIDFIRSTDLKAAIEGLQAVTKITAEELERRFAKARAKDADLLRRGPSRAAGPRPATR